MQPDHFRLHLQQGVGVVQVGSSPQEEVVEVQVDMLLRMAVDLEVVGQLVGLEEQEGHMQNQRPACLSPDTPSPAVLVSDALDWTEIDRSFIAEICCC